MDHIKAQIDNLAELTDEQITALEAGIISKFDEFAEADRTAETVDAMSEAADMLDSVRGEVVRREALAEELEARASEAASRVHGGPEEEEPEEAPESDAIDEEEDDDIPVTASADSEEVATSEPVEEFSAPEVEAPAEAAVEETVEEATPEAEASVEEVTDAESAETIPEAEAAVEEVALETTPAESEAAVEETVAEVEAPVEAEASVEVVEPTTIEQIAQEEAQIVTASADETFEAPADRRPDLQVTEAPVAIVAGADIPGLSAGQTISDTLGVAKAFTDRLHTLRRANGGDGEQHTVASFVTSYPETRSLVAGAAEDNGVKIASVVEERSALVAAGGYAGIPSPQTYDIFGFGTDARPVKDSLPKMGADRGTISYIEPPQLAAYADAVGVWTPAMDEAAAGNGGSGADVVKNLLVVQGAQTRYAELDAITLQLQIGNLLSRSYPELVQRHNELALIQHARLAEKTILAKIGAGSTAVTASARLGVARDFLVTVRQAATQYRSRHRLPLETPLQSIIPNWLFEAIASDLTLQMPGDDMLGVTSGAIRGYLSGSNVSFVASYDLNEFGAQAAGPLNSWDANGTGDVTFDWFLFSEGTWVFLDGGTLDIGIVRDSALVGTNDYRMFVETFEGVAKIGIESLKVTQTFRVSGAASALEDINS